MGYLHIDAITTQSAKRPEWPCGDSVVCDRNSSGTTLILCDGLGSGIRASVAAQFVSTRLMEKVRSEGASVRGAFADVVRTLESNRGGELPWGAFSLARIRPDGDCVILSYESPPPVLISRRHAMVLPGRQVLPGEALVTETNCCLEPGDAVLLMSDGITQAGLGNGLPEGWTSEGVCRELNLRLSEGAKVADVPPMVEARAKQLWGDKQGDDCTAMLASARQGLVVNLFTGPPASREKDGEVVRRFLEKGDFKVVCGASTARLVARELGQKLEVEQDSASLMAPPRYRIEGVDLVTEGAVCLNQLYNILEEDPAHFEERSAVTDLHDLLRVGDRIHIFQGVASNPASESISFRQQGILTRRKIVPLLADRLRGSGKLVEVENV